MELLPGIVDAVQAIAAAIYLARTGHSKDFMKTYLSTTFHYDLDRTLSDIRPGYSFDVTCQGSVPEAIIAFLESDSYEDAVRKAVSLGGDADTQACMAGAIAQAFYGDVPEAYKKLALDRLPADLRDVAEEFETFRQDPAAASGTVWPCGGMELIKPIAPEGYTPFSSSSAGRNP